MKQHILPPTKKKGIGAWTPEWKTKTDECLSNIQFSYFARTTHVKTHRAGTDRNFYLNVSPFRFVVPNYDLRWPASLEMGLMVRAEFVFTGNGT